MRSRVGKPISHVETELPLQRPNDPRDVGAVRAAVAHHAQGPARAALLCADSDHSAAVHAGYLASQVRNRLGNYLPIIEIREALCVVVKRVTPAIAGERRTSS